VHAPAANGRHAALTSCVAGAPGNAQLVECINALATARKAEDPVASHAALIDLAGAALARARLFGAD
jgi:hypothetical protein